MSPLLLLNLLKDARYIAQSYKQAKLNSLEMYWGLSSCSKTSFSSRMNNGKLPIDNYST
jgi:hypothetical protein